jgi:hypothetical protein
MENVKIEVNGDTMTITVDLSHDGGGLSNSGKSRTIASTRGNVKIEGSDAVMGLNVYRKVS